MTLSPVQLRPRNPSSQKHWTLELTPSSSLSKKKKITASTEAKYLNGPEDLAVYYIARFNKTQHPDAAILAMFYLFILERDKDLPQ